jgi:hypothetical protein
VTDPALGRVQTVLRVAAYYPPLLAPLFHSTPTAEMTAEAVTLEEASDGTQTLSVQGLPKRGRWTRTVTYDLGRQYPAELRGVVSTLRQALREHGHGDHPEYLCGSCNTINPPQPGRTIAHPCPRCGAVMEPTSPNLREIARLRAVIAGLQKTGEE